MHDFVAGRLRDIGAVEGNDARSCGNQSDDGLHRGGFSGAVGSDQRHDLALVYLKADAFEGTDYTVRTYM